ncbi:L,D-transpeptidase [Prosthecobacter sp.]|uniref:L,D-transpeptidase n=1 Tax=Prosthecobacter sp. TaxID=1965333 RepID=UPI001D7CADE9|nr:L,D-transpeptidase [Prosthecobacter sp.]MCB1277106.1 L,D-transpeptidase [Prosthecobacter sp.]
MKTSRFSLAVIGMLVLCQCELPEYPLFSARREMVRRPLLVLPAFASQSPLYVWHGNGRPGPLSVNIDLSQQKAYLFKNGQSVGWTYVATGRSGYATPTGTFRIMEKIANKRSNKYGMIVDSRGNVVNSNATAGVSRVPPGGQFVGARMPYWMRITGYGVGMHAGPIPRPGSPASHGCIRLPASMAETIFQHADVGTRVTIMQ